MGEKQMDLINRDYNNLNNYIQVNFDEVLSEPDGTHSAECIWMSSNSCFECGKNIAYKILTYCCGLCIALNWGCVFACVSFSSIWGWTPLLRIMSILLHPFKKIILITLTTFVGPCMETTGLIFSRIHVVNSSGPPPRSSDQLEENKVQNFN